MGAHAGGTTVGALGDSEVPDRQSMNVVMLGQVVRGEEGSYDINFLSASMGLPTEPTALK